MLRLFKRGTGSSSSSSSIDRKQELRKRLADLEAELAHLDAEGSTETAADDSDEDEERRERMSLLWGCDCRRLPYRNQPFS